MNNFASASFKSIIGGIGFALAALVSTETTGEQPPLPLSAPASQLVAAAGAQVGITIIYDPAFVKLAYPGGDLPRERGVCTDVIVRAYRDAFGIDLQQLVHADMLASFASYPPKWGLRAPDTSIDHRRVLNLKVFFRRKGQELPVSGRTMARSGLRMMPTFPSSPLRFRTAGFPQYGSKAGLSDSAFPNRVSVKLAPSIPVARIRFASILRALRSSMGPPP